MELLKQIIDYERQIENIKRINSENYIAFSKNKTNKTLEKELKENENQKEKLNSELGNKFIAISTLKGQRKNLQVEIKKFQNKETSLKLLNDYYSYYTTLIENMNYNHKEFINKNTMIIQNLQIKELVDQLRNRDNVLSRLNIEFTKKNMIFKPEGVRDYEDFSKEPLRSNYNPSSYPTLEKLKDQKHEGKDYRPENTKMNDRYKSNNKNNLVNLNTNSKANNIYENDKERSKSIKRSFNWELSRQDKNLVINHPLKLNTEKYSMKLDQFNRNIPSFQATKSLNDSLNKSFNSRPISNNKNRQSGESELFKRSGDVFDQFEKERKKFLKIYTRKDIIGRFRSSPYLKH